MKAFLGDYYKDFLFLFELKQIMAILRSVFSHKSKIDSQKRKDHNGGFPRYVLNQLKIFVPVGKDIKIVTPEK